MSSSISTNERTLAVKQLYRGRHRAAWPAGPGRSLANGHSIPWIASPRSPLDRGPFHSIRGELRVLTSKRERHTLTLKSLPVVFSVSRYILCSSYRRFLAFLFSSSPRVSVSTLLSARSILSRCSEPRSAERTLFLENTVFSLFCRRNSFLTTNNVKLRVTSRTNHFVM